jgi:hypothetical protein
VLALLVICAALLPVSHAAQQKTIEDVIVNLGIVSAGQARGFPGEAERHPGARASGGQHLLISLRHAKTLEPISGAEVTVEIRDPRGNTQRKTLTEATTAGVPDYSGLVTFAWAGTYKIKVTIKRRGSKRPLVTTLSWMHDI